MTSPLLPYANAYALITTESAPEIENGRVVVTADDKYLLQIYCVRQDSTGATTGADYLPTQTTPGDNMPGASGVVYLYRGYALRYAAVDEDYELGDTLPTDWTNIESRPSWLVDGMSCQYAHGEVSMQHARIERSSGKYGNSGIDQIIIKEVGGLPIVIRAGEIVD